MKAGLFHAHQSYAPTPTDNLPTVLEQSLDKLPPANIWLPDVYWVALGLAHADAQFPHNDDAYIADERRRARSLMDASTYKMLRLMTSPRVYVRSAPQRWQTFHRGSDLRLVSSSEHQAVMTLSFPQGLFPPLFLRQVASTFEVMCGVVAGWARVHLEAIGSENARLSFRWGQDATSR